MVMEDDKKTCVCIQCELSCCINVSRLLYVSSNEIIINMEIKTGNVFKLNFDSWCCVSWRWGRNLQQLFTRIIIYLSFGF